MKRPLVVLGIVVLCLPMVFVSWLYAAVYWPKLDAMTLRAPMFFRSTIADVIVQQKAEPAPFPRAKRLNPGVNISVATMMDSVARKDRVSHGASGLSHGEMVNSPEAKALDREGQGYEAEGDECSAAASYLVAQSKEDHTDAVYLYSEHLGRASLLCGHMGDAQTGLEGAIKKEQRLMNFSVGDESATQAAMLKDREWLIVVYDKVGETSFAERTCSEAHPDWVSCVCSLKRKDVSCVAGTS